MAEPSTTPAGALPRLLTVTEVCTALRISDNTLTRMVRRGELHPIKFASGTMRFRLDELEHLLGVDA